MKKIFLIAIAIIVSPTFLIAQSTDTSVESRIYGVQTGFFGAWFYNEIGLSNSIALRLEAGLDGGIESSFLMEDQLVAFPVFTIEPRWYYNLHRRVEKSKRIDANSGNFISIKTSFRPDLFILGGDDRVSIIPDLQIIPTYGLRRNLGQHFNYEVGFGIGYVRYFEPKNVILIGDRSDVAVNLLLRIGYRF
jgi:hypothetical protein